ncbi:MAG: DUF1801 domain-containing protein [Armatimonadota bacterium]
MEKFSSVDLYLETVTNDEARNALTWMRSVIKDELPDAVETMSYGMPMFNIHGMVVGIAAFKNHCSLFPGHTVADFAEELKDYKTSKGTIQFSPKKPLPEALIRAIVKKRADENLALAVEKKKTK